jgi:Tn3 transposase DDE domain
VAVHEHRVSFKSCSNPQGSSARASYERVGPLISSKRRNVRERVGSGEMGSNRREDHEISMLALHLIQNCMVYINTLMIQKLLAQPHWQGMLTPRDYAALTPLIWEHVNPYGRFDLDMNTRLALL